MKKKLLAVAALSAIASVAQADVQLFGTLDVAVGSIQHDLSGSSTFPATVDPVDVLKTANTGTVTGMFNGGISPSRWGIKGSEDLGSGTKAIFWLESGINLNSGSSSNAASSLAAGAQGTTNTTTYPTTMGAASSISGQLFSRQAWVGLSDDKLGQLIAGRVYAPAFDIVVGYDPVQAAQLFSPLGFSGTWGGSLGATENLRNDNSIRYSNNVGDVNYGLFYKFGQVSGNNSAGTGYGINAGYESGKFGIQGAYQAFKDTYDVGAISGTVNATALNEVATSQFNTSGFMIAAKYKLTDAATIKIGAESFTRSTPSNPTTTATTPAYYGYTVYSNTAFGSGISQNYHAYWVGGDYNFTPAFNVGAAYYVLSTDNKTGSAITANDLHFVSLLADYKFSKRTDVYAGLMMESASGVAYDPAQGQFNTNNSIFGLGMRHKF